LAPFASSSSWSHLAPFVQKKGQKNISGGGGMCFVAAKMSDKLAVCFGRSVGLSFNVVCSFA
jgi:hypothetical protein